MNKDYVEMLLNLHPIAVATVCSKVRYHIGFFSLQINSFVLGVSQKNVLLVLEFLTGQFLRKKITEHIIYYKNKLIQTCHTIAMCS